MPMNKQQQAPLFHISKRKALPWYQAWGIRGAAIILALVVCAVATTLMTGEDPIQVYITMFEGALAPAGRSGSYARISPFCCVSPWR